MSPTTLSIQTIIAALVLTLSVGIILGILLMCVLHVASPEQEPEHGIIHNSTPSNPFDRPEGPTWPPSRKDRRR